MAKIRRFWLVAPLDIKEDTTQGRVGNNIAFPEEVRPARIARGEAQLEAQAVNTGYGFKIQSADIKRMNTAFTSEDAAQTYAREQAEKNPKVLFGVFGCSGTYETTTPTIIKKSFNEDGELTLSKE
jgi:hypothetical protein